MSGWASLGMDLGRDWVRIGGGASELRGHPRRIGSDGVVWLVPMVAPTLAEERGSSSIRTRQRPRCPISLITETSAVAPRNRGQERA
jgi:hypothetical protein